MADITQEQIDHFTAITSVPADRARFYLEAANGDLNVAVERFLEDDANAPVSGEVVPPPRIMSNTIDATSGRSDDDDDDDDNTPFNRHLQAAAATSKKPEVKKLPAGSGGSSRIHTLNSFANRDDEGNDDEDDRDEKGQAFYAGGSETSGQQIIGPSKKNPDRIIKDLFKKAKEHGAEEVQQDSGSASTSRGPVVYGTGYRLGTGDEPSEVIKGPERPKPPKVNILKLWKNGFNVDDGPLRSYDDPQNREFLAAIQRGEPPRELIQQAGGAEVNLDMQDHRDEEFVPPKPKADYGPGYKLGSSPTPNVVSTASASDKASNEESAKRNLNVDEKKPTTQIQVRLSDGSRIIIKANQDHTIANLRTYINTARPEYREVTYSLLTSFPNKELTENNESIFEAKLLNAVIIQKLK